MIRPARLHTAASAPRPRGSTRDRRPLPDLVATAAVALSLALALAVAGAAAAQPAGGGPGAAQAAIDEGDRSWTTRAEGSKGGTAEAGPVEASLAAYRRAAELDPESIEARWRLMRALYFKGEHVVTDAAAKRDVFDAGKKVGEETLAIVRRKAGASAGRPLEKASPVELVPWVKGRRDVTAAFLWAAVDWGKWAIVFGKTAAVRQGAAAKIRDYCEAVIALDPAFEDAGGYRVLGRLHHQTPAVPFFTGWASREKALANLRLAVKGAPRNFVNRLYLAEAMWDYEKGSRQEARAMLEALAAEKPSAEWVVEDARAQEDARALLAAWR